MSRPVPPPRLHFYLARAAPVGLILRRGPTRWVRLIRWDTETDTFEPGAWLKGRLYEEKCDLSPDGHLFVYFAAKPSISFRSPAAAARGERPDPNLYSWTAISRPPWLHALALWKGTGTWNGGGNFLDHRRVLLHLGYGSPEPHRDFPLPRGLKAEPSPDSHTDWTSVLRRRLEASGWQFSSAPAGLWSRLFHAVTGRTPGPFPAVKPHPSASSALELREETRLHRSRMYEETRRRFFLRFDPDEPEPLEVEWADWDHRGRLVYTAEGRLWAREVRDGALQPPRELADFRDMQPDPVPPPEWATRWE